MLIYNITTKVGHAVKEAWLQWMKKEMIVEMMKTGLFSDYRFCHLIENDDEEGATYVAQYHCDSREHYDSFVNEHDQRLKELARQRFGDQYISFRTIMEIVK